MAAPGEMLFPEKAGHKKYRAALKKEKRRKRRQELARLRDSGLAQKEEEDAFMEERQRDGEKRLETERRKLHEAWLRREQKAQEEFRVKKEKEEAVRRRQAEQERKLREAGEEQQRREREEEERKRQQKKERGEAARQMLVRAERELGSGAAWQNPEPPAGLGVMEKERARCPFYSKTGACRFGARCSRTHNSPSSSPTLLIRGMFRTFGMQQCGRDAEDPDAGLEHTEDETYQQFLDFYEDVLPEFKNVGKVIQFKVSCNLEPHLRGNVYVQYQSEGECQAALSLFNGRWYAGRQLHCEFCPVTRWKTAICGLSEIQQCPRGKHCNFLHVFRNPNNEFGDANRDVYLSPDGTGSSLGKDSRRRERRGIHDQYYYSRRRRRRRSPSSDHSYKRNGESERKRRSSHRRKKSHKHTSGSQERRSSRRRGRKRGRSPSLSRSPTRSLSHRSRRSKSRSRRSHSQSSSRSRGRGGRRSGSRGRNLPSPKAK